MDFSTLIPELLTLLGTCASAFLAVKVTATKNEESINVIKQEIIDLNNKIEKLYEIDKRLSILEERLANHAGNQN